MTIDTAANYSPPLSDWAIAPGEYLAEVLEDLGMSQAELSRRMGRPAQAINELIKGEKELTPETALQLEQVLEIPAHTWASLEAEYRLVLAQQAAQEQMVSEQSLLVRYPLKKLAELGFIRRLRDKTEQVRELRHFFGVATLTAIPEVRAYQPAFRRHSGTKDHSHALAAWLRAGALLAEKRESAVFDLERLQSCIPGIRHLSCEDPATGIPKLKVQLEACGVVLVPLPHFDGTGVHGAVFWERPSGLERAVVMVTLRRKYSDTFWFSLLHELGHVVLHKPDRRTVFLDDSEVTAEQEAQANAFASDALLGLARYSAFVQQLDYSEVAVRAFAAQENICPGIVVGRLQIDRHILFSDLDHLRPRYEFTPEDFA